MDESLMELLESLNTSSQEGSYSREKLDQTAEYFELVSATIGVQEAFFPTVVEIILSLHRLPTARFESYLLNCMPATKIETETLAKLVTKCVGFASELGSTKREKEKGALIVQYLVGLVKYNIVDQHQMKMFYCHFFVLLPNVAVQEWAAQLIYYLTNQKNLTYWCVVYVQDVLKTAPRKEPFKALLALFKRLKPDFVVQDTISVKAEKTSFLPLDAAFVERLEWTNKRMNKPAMGILAHPDTFQIVLASSAFPRHVESIDSATRSRAFLNFYLIADFLQSGTNYMSLLEHEYNFLFFAVMPDRDRANFECFLQRRFVEIGTSTTSGHVLLSGLNRIDSFNPGIINLQKCTKKLLPDIRIWFDYTKDILPFIPKLQFRTYRKLFELVLKPLYFVFVASYENVSLMRDICESYAEFVLQQYKNISTCNSEAERTQYLPETDLLVVVDGLKHFTKILMNLEPTTFETQFCVLSVYNVILEGEKLVTVSNLSIVPKGVALILPTADSAFLLEVYSKLLENSLKAAEKKSYSELNNSVVYIGKQIRALYDQLMGHPIESKRILNNSISYQELQCISKRKNALKMTHNIAFWSYTRFDNEGKWLDTATINKNRLNKLCPTLMRLLCNLKHAYYKGAT